MKMRLARHGVALSLAGMIVAPAVMADTKSASRVVHYAPPPRWVVPPPVASDAPTPPGAAGRVIYVDEQLRLGADGEETFESYRLKVLAPEGLSAGNIAITWAPASEELTVNRLSVVRNGKPIDVLATQKFAIIQRENNLEQAVLDGNLTATLQVAGLQVGDELEFAATKVGRDTLLGTRPQGFMQFPTLGVRGAYRLRVLEKAGLAVAYRASANVPPATVTPSPDGTERRYDLSDPATAIVPDGAPARYGISRLIQYSSYPDWSAVSRTFDVLFARATLLRADSPVKREAARIAAESTDPARRAEAALRTVEDRIRYVYVGLDGGNYLPATADETWQRSFGDCKAKTVLLIALLRELGIAAEPVLINSQGGDGIDQRLPTPGVFDHVLVRATVAGAPVWLDGTRLGDRSLGDLDPPASRWGLPLRSAGATLEPIPALPPRRPQLIEAVDIDASAGFDKPGKYRIQRTLRGSQVFTLQAQLAGVAAADADRMLAAYWRQQLPDVEPSHTSWRFDETQRLLVLSMEGEGKVDWDGDATDGHTHYLFGAGFPPPATMTRPKDQPQDAPWATEYPAFTCYATTVKVPPAGKGFHWSFSSKPVDRTLGGIDYWRISSFRDGVARMVKSRRVTVPEISATEARSVNAAIATFDNNKSYLSETTEPSLDQLLAMGQTAAAFGSFEDFAGANPPCQSASRAKVE